MMDIAFTLSYLRPSEEWMLDGNEYSGLTWLADTTIPTEQELEDAYPKALAAQEAKKLADKAAREAAIAHAKSLGFTDEMIAVMYPNLGGN
jgi:hypothetical protein